jgi:hypothetical protein
MGCCGARLSGRDEGVSAVLPRRRASLVASKGVTAVLPLVSATQTGGSPPLPAPRTAGCLDYPPGRGDTGRFCALLRASATVPACAFPHGVRFDRSKKAGRTAVLCTRRRQTRRRCDIRPLNLASWDRFLRILLALSMMSVGWLVPSGGLWAASLKVLGFFPLITGLWGWCPMYAVLGVDTRRIWRRTH